MLKQDQYGWFHEVPDEETVEDQEPEPEKPTPPVADKPRRGRPVSSKNKR